MNRFLTCLGFDAQKHSVKVEMMAGLTTFLTISYILAVNPIILGDAWMDKGAVFSATCIAAVVATAVVVLTFGKGLLKLLPKGVEESHGDMPCEL